MEHLTLETAALRRALRERDANTYAHCARTSGLSVETGRAMGLSSQELATLGLAAELHDVGKIGIPDRILCKPGRLDEDELRIMRTHPRLGHHILCEVPNALIESVAQIVLTHHEAFDGNGYPDGLKAEEISVLARIVSIADSYDAIASVRPYHAPKTHTQVMQMLHDEQGRKYDPQVLATFARVVESSPFKAAD